MWPNIKENPVYIYANTCTNTSIFMHKHIYHLPLEMYVTEPYWLTDYYM